MGTLRGLRTAQFVLFGLLLVGLVAVGTDQAFATVAESQIAQRAAPYGFVGQPSVTVLGFPFLPQLIGGHLDGIDLTAAALRSGDLTTTDIHAHVRGIVLGSGSGPTTLTTLTGTGLVTFADLERLAHARVPGLVISAAGPGRPHQVSLKLTVAIVTISAVATVALTPADAVVLRITSAPGVPSFLLNPLRVITIHLPKLPLGLTLRQITIAHSGALVAVSAHDVRLGGRP